MYVCLSSRLKKINTTGVASVKPGEARELISAANLRQMKFCQKRKKRFRQKRKKKSFVKNVKKKVCSKKEVSSKTEKTETNVL